MSVDEKSLHIVTTDELADDMARAWEVLRPKPDEVAALVDAFDRIVEAGLREESWRRWGIGDQHVQDRARIRRQFRQERRP